MAVPQDIMIVDDNPANLKLLEDMLVGQGHEVRSFPSGRLAIAAAKRNPPDLVLLDINMPEMNGYQVCEQLKATPQLTSVPVIFLSALSETEDKVKAFQSGGVDYISKPFQFDEVHARVETHLNLHNLRQTLLRHNEQLEETVAARTRELAEANRRLALLDRSKSEFLDLISHEFRTPLVGLLGVGEIILEQMPSTKDSVELQRLFDRSRNRILSLLDDALLLGQIDANSERFRSAPVLLNRVLTRAVGSAADFAASRRVEIARPPEQPWLVFGDEELLARAFQALLETAVKFSEKGETVRLWCEALPDSAVVLIEGTGRVVPSGALERFFDLLSIGEAIVPGGDLGVGPPLASRIFALFGASVSVANREPPGIRLSISLRDATAAPKPQAPA